ncbi:hypothetical protein Dimus_021487 [Dionaea muscipula]
MPSRTLDVVDFVVSKGHGVRGLSNIGLKKVPTQYVQPPEERLDAAKVVSDETIPIIDAANWNDDQQEAVYGSIIEAARKYGFFQIINHGIPIDVLDEVQAAAHCFFELPTEEKVKYKKDPCGGGTVKMGTSFSPNKEKVMEWKDYLSLQYFSHSDATADWPPICRSQAVDYLKRVQAIVRKIYDALLVGLNAKGFDETKEDLLMAWIAVNFNYYPYCPNPELTVGVGRHSDGSALTVLLQDDVGGLYVRAPDGESWIHVRPTRGALVVNIGDMLQLLSNGRYKSIEHKVVVNPRKNRVSIAVFVNPAPDQVVGPLPEVLVGGEKPLYREVIFLDYFKYFFSKGHDGKATIEWAKILN